MRLNRANRTTFCLILGACLVGGPQSIFAAGRPAPPPAPTTPHRTPPGKQVIEVVATSRQNIQFPGETTPLNVAKTLFEHLTGQLVQTQRYVPMDTRVGSSVSAIQADGAAPIFEWSSQLIPATRMEMEVTELSFRSGTGGNRMFYGFDRLTEAWPNDFPLRESGQRPSWMGARYDGYGDSWTGSRVGLDLTESFKIDFLFAFLQVQWTEYSGHIGLKIRLTHPDGIGNSENFLDFESKGLYLDVTGGYMGWSAGIEFARRNAWVNALEKAQRNLAGWLDNQIRDQRLFAQIDFVNKDYTLLIATGLSAGVKPGTQYALMADPRIKIEVTASYPSGSHARFITPPPLVPVQQWLGLRFREILPGESQVGSVASAVQALSAELDPNDIPDRSDHFILTQERHDVSVDKAVAEAAPNPQFPQESRVAAFFRSIIEIFRLPYRISRANAYDRSPPGSAPEKLESPISGNRPVYSSVEWHREMRATGWGHALSLDRSTPFAQILPISNQYAIARQHPVTVAVVDTGIDFWHPSVHNARSRSQHYDFISGDGRAHDDQGHGTQMASIVTGVAPHAQLLSLKVFNPWGITTTSAIVSAIQQAITEKAEIILLPWNTELPIGIFETLANRFEGANCVFVVSGGAREPSRLASTRENSFKTPWISVGGLGNSEQPSSDLTHVIDHRVTVAVPASQLPQARPRRQWFISGPEGSSDQAAAVFAAATARKMVLRNLDAQSAVHELLSETVVRPALRNLVQDGRVLNVLR